MVAATAAALAAALAASLAAALATNRERVASCDQFCDQRDGVVKAPRICAFEKGRTKLDFFVMHAPLGGALFEVGVRMHTRI